MTADYSSEVQKKIEDILAQRNRMLGPVQAQIDNWRTIGRNAENLGEGLDALARLCDDAIGEDDPEKDVFADLQSELKAISDSGEVEKLKMAAVDAQTKLGRLEQRFNRNTINIAVAGVGKSGKSTSLKSIIGKPQDDNSVIPSGFGEAITAGKSTIESVVSKGEEGTTVFFHTVDSFLSEIVNPILDGAGLRPCRSVFDFSGLDIDRLIGDLEKRLSGGLLNANKAQLASLRKIQRALPDFESLLGADPKNVPIDQTCKYVSYPKGASEKFVCYAVKECHIRTVFPNNEVTSLQLVDLPGLGTNSLAEKRCFKDGFNYAVDLALMVRRPTALFGNYPTDDDQSVINVLCDTFGEKNLHDCMVLFQNDANLPGADEAIVSVENENKERQRRGEGQIVVIRGDAMSNDFMQKTLMPRLLAFVTDTLPRLDRTFSNEVMPAVERAAAECSGTYDGIKRRINAICRKFQGQGGGVAACVGKQKEMVDRIVNEVNRLVNMFGEQFKTDDSNQLSGMIATLTQSLRVWVDKEYSLGNAPMVEQAWQRIKNTGSVIPFLVDEHEGQVPALKNRITKAYEGLDKVHDVLIAKMQSEVAAMLAGVFGGVVGPSASLQDILGQEQIASQCPVFAAALRRLAELKVPFYDYIFPDIHAKVFSKITEDVLTRRFPMPDEVGSEEKAKRAVYLLNAFGRQLVKDTETLLYDQSKISDVICAALEKFKTMVVGDREVGREFLNFVGENWTALQSGVRGRGSEAQQIVSRF